jgi:BASS family bile acid:Na+ symporter
MEFQLFNFLIAPTLLSLMLSLGLNLTFAQVIFLWTKTRLLVRSILSVVILVPITGILAALLLPVESALRVVILAMAAAPGAPLTTKRVVMSGGNLSYGGSLQVTVSIMAIITVPFWAVIYDAIFPASVIIDVVAIAKSIALVQLLPIGIGILIQHYWSAFANKVEPIITKIANILFFALILMILVNTFRLLPGVGILPFLLITPVIAVWLLLGHVLGGPTLEQRATLAIGTIARNVGLALLLLQVNVPPEEMQDLLPLVITFILVGVVGGAIYTAVLKKSAAFDSKIEEHKDGV